MMDGWQRRLTDGGDSVRVEELKRGMNLDLNYNSTEDTSMQDQTENNISPILEDEEEGEMSETEDRAPEPVSEPAPTRSKFRKVPERSDRALQERSDNARPKRMRKVSFTPGLQGSPCEPSVDNEETLQIKAHQSEAVTRRPSRRKTESKPSREVSQFERLHANQDVSSANTSRSDQWPRVWIERHPEIGRCRRRGSHRRANTQRARIKKAKSA